LGGNQHQHTVRVAVDQPGHRRMGILGQGIRHHARERHNLTVCRDHLPADRILRVIRIHQGCKVRRHFHPEMPLMCKRTFLAFGQFQYRFKILQRIQSVA